MITYTPFSDHQPGLIFNMLQKSYESYPEIEKIEKESWREFDMNIFSDLDTIGKCGFVSCLEDKIIGFASWDPRNHPDFVIIGHNCILPDYRRQGFGRLQILEMLNRFKSMNFRKVKATTGSVSFFVPAQRMYLSCGFHEVGRALHEVIYYEKELCE